MANTKVHSAAGVQMSEAGMYYQQRWERDDGKNTTYWGFAPPGAGTDDAAWAIMKMTHSDGAYNDENPLTKVWADGTNAMIKVCDDRADYTYAE